MKLFVIDTAEITWEYGCKNRFEIAGSFQLPNGYSVADLHKSAFLHFEIAGVKAKDKVYLGGSSLSWTYYDITFGRGDDSLGEGLDIKKMHINWSFPQKQFHIKGELCLPGIGPYTLPREAIIMLEMPVAPYGQAGSVAGKKKVEFKMSGGSAWVMSGQSAAGDLADDPPTERPPTDAPSTPPPTEPPTTPPPSNPPPTEPPDTPDDNPDTGDGSNPPPANEPAESFVDLAAGISFRGTPASVMIAGSGIGLNLQTEVTNAGSAAVSSGKRVDIEIYARPADAAGSSQDTLLETLNNQSIGGLAAGSSKQFNATVYLPNSLASGEYVFVVCADTTDNVPESDETNNSAVTDDSIRVISLGINWPF
jgi:hypothetical protein